MTKYLIEGEIDFYKKLYESLDDNTEHEENICNITGSPLIDKYVTLECNHSFNY